MGNTLRARKMVRYLQALKDNGGISTAACDSVGIGYPEPYKWAERYPTFKAKWEKVRRAATEVMLDTVESKAMERVRGNDQYPPDVQMIKFLLATKGKHRGYTQQTEITGPGGEAVRIIVESKEEGV